MELYKLQASELSQMLQNKECSSVELTKSVLGRIDAKAVSYTHLDVYKRQVPGSCADRAPDRAFSARCWA